jgi:PadR family transcriptional regulator PadR
VRTTEPLLQVAEVLLADPQARFWGYDLSRRAHVRSGVLYPLLRRLLEDGWLADGWEQPNARKRNAPPRRYYTVTDAGAEKLREALATRPVTARQSWKPQVV